MRNVNPPMNRLNYFCVVEGQQEKMYLNRLAKLLSDFPKRTVTFNPVIDNAERLRRNYVEYDCVCLFDNDFKQIEFERSIKTCLELDAKKSKKAKQNSGSRVWHAYSHICFDLWLALHKEFIGRPANSTGEYIPDVIRLYNLAKDSDIKQEKVIERIINQIELHDVKRAISYAKRIRNSKLQEDKHVIKTKDIDYTYYSDPDFSIDTFIEDVMNKMGISV